MSHSVNVMMSRAKHVLDQREKVRERERERGIKKLANRPAPKTFTKVHSVVFTCYSFKYKGGFFPFAFLFSKKSSDSVIALQQPNNLKPSAKKDKVYSLCKATFELSDGFVP